MAVFKFKIMSSIATSNCSEEHNMPILKVEALKIEPPRISETSPPVYTSTLSYPEGYTVAS
jgi:hypothetical protein